MRCEDLESASKLCIFFSDILHLCFSICQVETLSHRLGHDSGSLLLALCPAIQHYHCGICCGAGLSFFPVTLVSPSHILPQMLRTDLPSGAGAVGPYEATVPSSCLALIIDLKDHTCTVPQLTPQVHKSQVPECRGEQIFNSDRPMTKRNGILLKVA